MTSGMKSCAACSSAYAYIAPQSGNPNLTVRLRSPVRRIIVEKGKAIGVRYVDRLGEENTALVDGEIIVSAGAIITPQLLMLSGIGPANHLSTHDIACVVDYGITITTVVVKPKSRGEIRLASSDPNQPPLVSPGLLSETDDLRQMIAGQRFFRRAFEREPLAGRLARVALPPPGADSDSMAVLDSRMRVHGVDRLRVCDMSAVPNINAGNTNAPAMMLGNRCADLMMGNL